jgi:hypothetical protein
VLDRTKSSILAITFAIAASTALAFTISEIAPRATSLDASYDDLIPRMESAHPADHAWLEAEAAGLSADLDQLAADRATLGTCNCSSLDGLLSELASEDDTVQVIIDGWVD